MPHEDNIDVTQVRKDERYEGMVKDCGNSGWQVVQFLVEVGCRGFYSHRMKGWLLTLGLSHRKVNKVSNGIQYAIHVDWECKSEINDLAAELDNLLNFIYTKDRSCSSTTLTCGIYILGY